MVTEYAGNFVLAFLIKKYARNLFSLAFSNKDRSVKRTQNARIEELRKKPYKTIEEQKEFTRLKFGVTTRRHTPLWRKLLKIAINFAVTMSLVFVITQLGVRANFFVMLIVGVFVGWLYNKIMSRYGLQQQDTFSNIFGR